MDRFPLRMPTHKNCGQQFVKWNHKRFENNKMIQDVYIYIDMFKTLKLDRWIILYMIWITCIYLYVTMYLYWYIHTWLKLLSKRFTTWSTLSGDSDMFAYIYLQWLPPLMAQVCCVAAGPCADAAAVQRPVAVGHIPGVWSIQTELRSRQLCARCMLLSMNIRCNPTNIKDQIRTSMILYF